MQLNNPSCDAGIRLKLERRKVLKRIKILCFVGKILKLLILLEFKTSFVLLSHPDCYPIINREIMELLCLDNLPKVILVLVRLPIEIFVMGGAS